MSSDNKYVIKAEAFLSDCVFDGLAHSFDTQKEQYVKPYPEVTGYVIKYFCDQNKITQPIIEAADYLVNLQNKDTGGFPSFFKPEYLYAFDTSQILIGMCNLYKKTGNEKYMECALKGGDFLRSMQLPNGAFVPIYDREKKEKVLDSRTYKIWNGPFSGLMCKLTEGYSALFKLTGDPEWEELIKLTASFYKNSDYIECSHPLGYWLEGLYAAEEYDKINDILKQYVIPRIKSNGFISYTPELNYAYVSGTIQLGIILYKMGYTELAETIRNYGRTVQNNHYSGGLFQYADENGQIDTSIHSEINSWGTKYFCELEQLTNGL